MKKIFWLLLNIAVSVFFIWLATSEIDWAAVGDSFSSVRPEWVVAAVVINYFSTWIRAYRWKLLLQPLKNISTYRAFVALMIGFMINNILPFRLGELARGYVIKRSEQIPFTATMGTVIVERAVDVITLLAVFALLTIVFPFPDWITTSGIVVGLIDVGVLSILILLSRQPEKTIFSITRICSLFSARLAETVGKILGSFLSGIQIHHGWLTNAWVGLLSFAIWVFYGFSIWLMCRAYDGTMLADFSMFDAMVVMTFSSFAVMLPSAPGYVGTFHEIVKQSFMLFSVPRELSLGFAILYHGVNYVVQIAIGVYFLIVNQIQIRESIHVEV